MVKRFKNDLQKIWASEDLVGIERIFDVIILFLKCFVFTEFILNFRKWRNPYAIVDVCVFCSTILLACILSLSDCSILVSVAASYILACMIISILNVVFLTKVFGRLVSPQRTLLLFFLNVIQTVLTFAIWYRWALSIDQVREAFFKALLVFATIDYPKGADIIVEAQIATDFVLLAIFLAFIFSNLERQPRKR